MTHNTKENRILRLLRNTNASEILYHHRFPTSTENVRNACHPFSTKKFFKHNYVLVHNGIIWNDEALHKAHQERGITYVSEQADGKFNDSEALLWDVALYLEGEQATLKAEGDIAFIVVENNEDGVPVKLHFGRNTGSPLYLTLNRKEMSLASEIDEQSKGHMVLANTLYTFDYDSYKLTQANLNIPEWRSYTNFPNGRANTSRHIPWWEAEDTMDSLATWEEELVANSIGFKTSGMNDIEETFWDSEKGAYVPLSQLVYGSDAYYMMVADKGESIALEIMNETGAIEVAIQETATRYDSVKGKIDRINEDIKGFNVATRRFNKLAKERFGLWIHQDILEEAISNLEEAIAEEVHTRMGEYGDHETPEQIARVINTVLAAESEDKPVDLERTY